MSRPRLLTDPAEIAASDEFKRCLIASKKTQEQVAAEIGEGVTQGTVWQWANRRLAIPVARARDAAKAVGARPAAISVAWRQFVNTEYSKGRTAEKATLDQPKYRVRDGDSAPSQRVGISLATVTDAMMVIRAYLDDRGDPVEHLPDPILVKAALDVVIERAEPLTLANVIAFKRQLATRVKESSDGDERGEATGTG